MKTLSSELLSLMQSSQTFTLADLYTITLTSGTVYRWADYDADLSVSGNVFSSTGPVLKRGLTRIVIGLEVDTLDVEIFPSIGHQVAGLPMLAAAVAGAFDGASLILDRAFIVDGAVVGTINMFSGVFADVEVARARISVRVNSDTASLQIQLPRSLYQASCLNALYSADCGASRSAFAVSSTAQSGSTASRIVCSSLNQASGWFNSGYCVFTSGDLAGVRRTVKAYSPGEFTIYNPLPAAPDVGDGFTIYPGCDKTKATCTAKFNNLENFRGFPFIPVPETAI